RCWRAPDRIVRWVPAARAATPPARQFVCSLYGDGCVRTISRRLRLIEFAVSADRRTHPPNVGRVSLLPDSTCRLGPRNHRAQKTTASAPDPRGDRKAPLAKFARPRSHRMTARLSPPGSASPCAGGSKRLLPGAQTLQ